MLLFCEMSVLVWEWQQGIQVQVLYLGGNYRKHAQGREKMRQRREGSHKTVCWKVVSYYTDNWSSDLLGTPADNVEGASRLGLLTGVSPKVGYTYASVIAQKLRAASRGDP